MRSRFRPAAASAALLVLAAPSAAAQQAARATPDSGGYVVLLGRDTVAVERFVRTADSLSGDILARSPRDRLIHYVATLGPDGAVRRFEFTSRPLAPSAQNGAAGAGGAAASGTITFGGDSARVEAHQGEQAMTYAVAAPAPAAPQVGAFSFALYEQALRAARSAAGSADSSTVNLVFPGARQPTATAVQRITPDSFSVSFFGLPAYVRLDPQGRLTRWNGLATTDKFVVDRKPAVPFERLVTRYAKEAAAGHALGELSPRDTTRAVVAGDTLWVDYGRPSVRGRTVLGGIVPFDSVWRTGANAATQFHTSRDITIGTTTIPAGTYTLFTLPSKNGARLIVNRQTGQWGTDYDAKQDLARIPLEQAKTPSPVERFTIGIEPQGQHGGVLTFSWAGTVWRAPFTVR